MVGGVKIGILFHAMVTSMIAVVAIVFVVFLARRWMLLDGARRAYAGFWIVTALVWTAITVRYFLIGGGYWGEEISNLDLFIQGAVFFTGPPLYYYAGMRIFSGKWIAVALAAASLVFIFIGEQFLLSEGGLTRVAVTRFSTETNLNAVSYKIFISNLVMLVVLIAYDFFMRIRRWLIVGDRMLLYDALYSITLLVYVGLGGIDNSKIFLGWELIVLRIFYIAAFLFAYNIIIEHEFSKENFLINNISQHD